MQEGRPQMSEAERRIADHVAEQTAQTVVARLLTAAKDREHAGEILEVWGNELDRIIGRAVRRALWLLFSGLAIFASIKLGLWEKLGGVFKP